MRHGGKIWTIFKEILKVSRKYKYKFQGNINSIPVNILVEYKKKVEVNGIGSGVRWDTVGKYKKYSMKY